ncbi:MAG TPA: hypothetical protein DHN33_07590 [Eubacteriaceae bacterium]|nr:hypothetical protein [Eubacteriaceae bacterium]
MSEILFVCTGNTCRSPMAEGLLKQLGQGRDGLVSSAGVLAADGQRASQMAVETMKKRGIDLSKHRSRSLTMEMVEEAEWVLTMTETHRNHILLLLPEHKSKVKTIKEFHDPQTKDLNVIDPYGMSLSAYEKTADELERLIRALIRQKKI